MSEAVLKTADLAPRKSLKKYMIAFFLITYGVFYGFALLYGFFPTLMEGLVGELTNDHPMIFFALHSPSLAGFLMYFWYGGWDGLLRFVKNLVPIGKDVKWIPITFLGMLGYLFLVRWGCMAVGIAVPEVTQSLGQNATILGTNLWMEVGMLGSAWGWYGFVYPFLNRRFKNHNISGALSGLALALYLLPAIDFSEPDMLLTFGIYVLSFVIYSALLSYILQETNNNVLFFITTFWVMSAGSKMQLYYFVWQTQVVQIALFLVMWLGLHLYFTRYKKPAVQNLQGLKFPDYLYPDQV